MKKLQPESSVYMSPKQAAEHFGVSVTTILRWIKKGSITALQPAGRYGRLLIPRW